MNFSIQSKLLAGNFTLHSPPIDLVNDVRGAIDKKNSLYLCSLTSAKHLIRLFTACFFKGLALPAQTELSDGSLAISKDEYKLSDYKIQFITSGSQTPLVCY